MKINYSEEVKLARKNGAPIVALESTLVAHGLPKPHNLETALNLEQIIRDNNAIPATIAVLNGEFRVGLNKKQIEMLATAKFVRKITTRDLPIAVTKKLTCATTVATTMFIANLAGIKVFATGGIGGVHRDYTADVSADLPALAKTPMITVCSGVKSVLDIRATREWLETYGVTVVGFQCIEMPAFYSRRSGSDVDQRVESVKGVIDIAKSRDLLKLPSAILVTVPVPKKSEIDIEVLEEMLEKSLVLAEAKGISGKKITPFLLSEMSKLSNGRTLDANIALLENNARIAAKIALEEKG